MRLIIFSREIKAVKNMANQKKKCNKVDKNGRLVLNHCPLSCKRWGGPCGPAGCADSSSFEVTVKKKTYTCKNLKKKWCWKKKKDKILYGEWCPLRCNLCSK
mmetsp:Transcript_8097/g.17596  ORF Transcript_8097/g.17596 Transcript_8097/m.17596 type:complete len:102 (-) Transcript_8097:229-534(-)